MTATTVDRSYNDFLVNEVTEEGQILHLTSMQLPAEDVAAAQAKKEQSTNDIKTIDELLQAVGAALGASQATKLEAWLTVRRGVVVAQHAAHNPGQAASAAMPKPTEDSGGKEGKRGKGGLRQGKRGREAGGPAELLLGPVQGGKQERTVRTPWE